MTRISRLRIIGISTVLGLLWFSHPAAHCQETAWGALTTSPDEEGRVRPIPDWVLADLIAEHIGPDSDILIVVAGNGGGLFLDNFDGLVTGPSDPVAFTDAVICAANPADRFFSVNGGYDEAFVDSINELGPERSIAELHARASLGADPRESPVCQGDLSKSLFGEKSTHALYWGVLPIDESERSIDAYERDEIFFQFGGTFGGSSVTPTLLVDDDALVKINGHPTLRGPATIPALATALAEIGEVMGPGEQFVFFTSTSGAVLAPSEVAQTIPAGGEVSAIVDLDADPIGDASVVWFRSLGSSLPPSTVVWAGYETGCCAALFDPEVRVELNDVEAEPKERHILFREDQSMELWQFPNSALDLPEPSGLEQAILGSSDGTVGQTVTIKNGTTSSLAVNRVVMGVGPLPQLSRGCPGFDGLCLNGSRYAVEAEWRDFRGNTGVAQVVPGGSDDSGLLWFFEPMNWEILVKVLDACGVNGHTWVFAAATTNVEYTLRVTDTRTGQLWDFSNPLGNQAPAVTDSRAFLCDDSSLPAVDEQGATPPVDSDAMTRAFFEDPVAAEPPTSAAEGNCVDGDDQLCLNEGRFQVEVDWRGFEGESGGGRVVPLRSADSGLFWFFAADNWEVLVKVLDACGVNNRVWVLAAATTNVEYTLRITDSQTGATRDYHNPLGNASDAIIDVEAFAACPVTDPGERATPPREGNLR